MLINITNKNFSDLDCIREGKKFLCVSYALMQTIFPPTA